ncbi:MAG TPA: hypothetical protein VGN48_07050 [Pedococcus sp.]|nr:hypothetical protein [Pedococcus sp.]
MGSTLRRDRAELRRAAEANRLRSLARRFGPEALLLVGVLSWWPAGFWGIQPWLQLPLHVAQGDILLFGAIAAAAAVSLFVRAPWPRFGVVLGFSVIGWLLSAPSKDSVPAERQTLVIVLAVAALVGILFGARGHRSLLSAATVLALVAGLSPATWPHGLPLAVALALPFGVASWQRVAPTLLAIARILLTWLVFGLLAAAVSHGWRVVHFGSAAGTRVHQLGLVTTTAWAFAKSQWWTLSQQSLSHQVGWFWVAAIFAVLVVAARVVTSGARRPGPADSTSRPGS